MEFDAIAAVVLGGTSFERGDGRLLGTVLGVATITVLRNALDLVGIESSLQVVSIGVLILVVIVIDSARRTWRAIPDDAGRRRRSRASVRPRIPLAPGPRVGTAFLRLLAR